MDGSRGQYRVQTEEGILLCSLRGRLRKELIYPVNQYMRQKVWIEKHKARDPLSVGNRVKVLPTGGNSGVIEEVIKEQNGSFTRGDSGKGNITSVAGLDQAVLVFSARNPEPHLRMLDRFLVVAEAQALPAIICLNKVDLGLSAELEDRLEVYRNLGYRVLLTSADEGWGIGDLRTALGGHTSALLGPSGVGKSSLLNTVQDGLAERVSAVSDATNKGRHTTTGTRLIDLEGPGGGYIADTAGIRALSLGGAAAGKLPWCFREFRPYLGQCKLGDCQHIGEPECALWAAVQRGAIDRERYESYRSLYKEGANEQGVRWQDTVSSTNVNAEYRRAVRSGGD